jgi:hypothetical protein
MMEITSDIDRLLGAETTQDTLRVLQAWPHSPPTDERLQPLPARAWNVASLRRRET